MKILIFDVYGTMGVFKNCFCISQEFFRDHKAIVTQSFCLKIIPQDYK